MSEHMYRRSFLTLLGGAAAAWPLAARGQQRPALPVVGILSGSPSGTYAPPDFREGLSQSGYVEGRNVALEYHWADGQNDRLPSLAADFVRRQVNVIVTSGIAATLAAKAATSTIPIVFTTGVNPVQLGLVASLNRPGGNLTGFTSTDSELTAKRLELLHEVVPKTAVIAALVNPTQQNAANTTGNLQTAARILGRQLHVLHATTSERDVDRVFAALRELRVGGLVISSDFNPQHAKLAMLALQDAIPAIFQYRDFVAVGGLMSYGGSPGDGPRLTGAYAGRILKGENPTDLPVQQVTRVELRINMKTAKALGLTFPTAILVRADEVIE
jgi:ABC-type uncharacterized transport system substrate-binding protein